ncbi:MAG: hypothetical protein ACFFF9_12470 [Candidatus Thorarchaeota archaeon]
MPELDLQTSIYNEWEDSYRRVPPDRGHLVSVEYALLQMVSWGNPKKPEGGKTKMSKTRIDSGRRNRVALLRFVNSLGGMVS